MAEAVSHGIASIQFTNAPAGGKFPAPAVWNGNDSTTLRNFRKIKPGSFSENKDEDQETEIRVEDAEGVYLTIGGEKGKKTFELESFDLSDEQLKYFMGYAAAGSDDTNLNGFTVKPLSFEMPRQCMRIVDRPIAGKERREWLYMPCKVVGEISGARTKTELRSLKLTVTLESNFNAQGVEIPNEAYKKIS